MCVHVYVHVCACVCDVCACVCDVCACVCACMCVHMCKATHYLVLGVLQVEEEAPVLHLILGSNVLVQIKQLVLDKAGHLRYLLLSHVKI